MVSESASQSAKLSSLLQSESDLQLKESKLIEKAKRLYGIDFSDREKVVEEAENERRVGEKEGLVKRISVVTGVLESNKK